MTYAHRHVMTTNEGDFNYYAHLRTRRRGTIQFTHDSKLYVYTATRHEARRVKDWFCSTFGRPARAVGAWPRYAIEYSDEPRARRPRGKKPENRLQLGELTHAVMVLWPGSTTFEVIAAFNCAPIAYAYRDDCEAENGKRGLQYKVEPTKTDED